MTTSAELKVGLLILAALGIVISASIVVTGWSPELAETYEVSVVFDNVTGLQAGSPVRIAGIKIGTIERIVLEDAQARVWLKVYSQYPINQGSSAGIKSIGILGDKYIEIDPGSSLQLPLQDKDEITRVITGSDLDSLIDTLSLALKDIQSVTSAMNQSFGGDKGRDRFDTILDNVEEITEYVKEITQVTNNRIDDITYQLDVFTKDLAEITQNNKRNIDEIVVNIRDFSGSLREITEENRRGIQELVADLQVFTDALSEDGPKITKELRSILEENRATLRSSLNNLDTSLAKLDSTMENVESISEKIDEGEGTIGQLVNDDTTVTELNEALESVNQLIGGVARIKLDIGVHAEYLGSNQSFYSQEARAKGYLSLRLQPLKDRFYLIQLIDNPRGLREIETVKRNRTVDGVDELVEEEKITVTEQLQFSLQIAQRYYDTQFRIGLFENQFGVGVDQILGSQENWMVSLDGWNFGGEFGPHLKFSTLWKWHSNLFFIAGADDFVSTETQFRSGFVGMGLMFNEDILRPIIGSLPLGAAQ